MKYLFYNPERRVVIVDPKNAPNTPEEHKKDSWIKRVVAVEDDTLAVKKGRLYVNGQMVEEEYVSFWDDKDISEKIIPKGYVYVMGDNRRGSHDSRVVGPVKVADIKGRAEFVWWPFSNWSWLR